MSDFNNIMLIGRLTADPEFKTVGNSSLTGFTVALNKTVNINGERKDYTSFVECKAWGKLGETISKFFQKGHRIGITGELRQERWESEGKKHSKIIVNVNGFNFIDKSSGNNDNKIENAFNGEQIDNPFNDGEIPF